jgi:hypothetical protein
MSKRRDFTHNGPGRMCWPRISNPLDWVKGYYQWIRIEHCAADEHCEECRRRATYWVSFSSSVVDVDRWPFCSHHVPRLVTEVPRG